MHPGRRAAAAAGPRGLGRLGAGRGRPSSSAGSSRRRRRVRSPGCWRPRRCTRSWCRAAGPGGGAVPARRLPAPEPGPGPHGARPADHRGVAAVPGDRARPGADGRPGLPVAAGARDGRRARRAADHGAAHGDPDAGRLRPAPGHPRRGLGAARTGHRPDRRPRPRAAQRAGRSGRSGAAADHPPRRRGPPGRPDAGGGARRAEPAAPDAADPGRRRRRRGRPDDRPERRRPARLRPGVRPGRLPAGGGHRRRARRRGGPAHPGGPARRPLHHPRHPGRPAPGRGARVADPPGRDEPAGQLRPARAPDPGGGAGPARRRAGAGAVEVRDHGPGLPDGQEQLEIVRGRHDEAAGGSGLGLHISAQLAQEHGGNLVLRTVHAPRGCLAVLTLPVAR
ncbi:ATP-binding protein [Pseudonocardia sp. ICBG601]|uniref:ATP-binding protein n=1 Tax=Pseudonocardia sp. ICBG601 TaxID=2846759 RepID=UPI0035ABD992